MLPQRIPYFFKHLLGMHPSILRRNQLYLLYVCIYIYVASILILLNHIPPSGK